MGVEKVGVCVFFLFQRVLPRGLKGVSGLFLFGTKMGSFFVWTKRKKQKKHTTKLQVGFRINTDRHLHAIVNQHLYMADRCVGGGGDSRLDAMLLVIY